MSNIFKSEIIVEFFLSGLKQYIWLIKKYTIKKVLSIFLCLIILAIKHTINDNMILYAIKANYMPKFVEQIHEHNRCILDTCLWRKGQCGAKPQYPAQWKVQYMNNSLIISKMYIYVYEWGCMRCMRCMTDTYDWRPQRSILCSY
jgi:hypothetical protein